MKSEEEMKSTVEALFKSNNDAEITVCVLMSMIVDHLNGVEFTDENIKKQWKVVYDILKRYNVQDMKGLHEMLEEGIMLRSGINLREMIPLDGIH